MTADRGTGGLVWLPFPPADLPEIPKGLAVDVFVGTEIPPSIDEVELYVLPYRFAVEDLQLIARMPRLKAVQTLTAGYEHVLRYLPPCVDLHNGRGIHDSSTAELALTLILASLRGVPGFVRGQDDRRWATEVRPALADKTVLIVGYGSIGTAVERRLDAFEASVVRVARTAREGVHSSDDLLTLLPGADVVVLVLPATTENIGLVDDAFLAAMKHGALLVNVARGSIVQTEALGAALRSGRISAALDVTDPEPLPADHPLWSCPNLLITPHVGGASSAMWPRAHRLVAAQLRRWVSGEPLDNRIRL